MNRVEAWLLHAATLLVGGTGVLYAVVRYVAEPSDPFSSVHPAQASVQHAHVWTAPLLVFALGLIWKSHAVVRSRSGPDGRRRSGLYLMATAGPLVFSGYFVQTAVDPVWRRVWVAVHLTTSILWLASYLAHQLAPRLATKLEAPQAGGDHAPTEADL